MDLIYDVAYSLGKGIGEKPPAIKEQKCLPLVHGSLGTCPNMQPGKFERNRKLWIFTRAILGSGFMCFPLASALKQTIVLHYIQTWGTVASFKLQWVSMSASGTTSGPSELTVVLTNQCSLSSGAMGSYGLSKSGTRYIQLPLACPRRDEEILYRPRLTAVLSQSGKNCEFLPLNWSFIFMFFRFA